MRALLTLAVFLLASLGPLHADEDPRPLVVVELFTSQGCSSCPPADALLRELATRDGVLPLALHVDYWDYIGWKDTFARHEHTLRQKAYAHAAGARSIYTPQMIVGGTTHVIGYRPMQVADAIHAARDRVAPIAINAALRDGRLAVTAELQESAGPKGGFVVQIVHFLPSAVVEITRGENAGQALSYSNIVTGWESVGEWDGQGQLVLDLPFSGETPAAVILQSPGPGAIWAAARID